ncbi:MAG: hypothetical protein Harvfovirus14_7 [Harvfovirus sp.]|uniref:Uncharacterized protein n=1 Tax=Harvfovirus sp. TaxID=2487768 RepID=A0A3G5A1C1_9VIRU|nr:MAG: hypothetical protein Harvfovirus14_7 [Harvfovirus sp.]
MIYLITMNGCIENMENNNRHKLLPGYLLYPFLDFPSNDNIKVAHPDKAKEFTNAIGFNSDGWVKTKVNYGEAIKADCDSYIKMSNKPSRIPKILHQIWIGPKPKPRLLERSREVMTRAGWQYKLWGFEEIEDLKMINNAQYNAAKLYPAKADIARIEILERFGGVYLDADTHFIKPFDENILRANFVSAYENEVMRPGLIANGFIGVVPNHKIIRMIRIALGNIPIDYIVKMTARTMWKVTGPKLLTKVIMEAGNNDDVLILPSYYLYPTHHTKFRLPNELTNLAYTDQIWQSTQDINNQLI